MKFFLLLFSLFTIQLLHAQDCDINCPGQINVYADSSGNYTVPDFFANGIVSTTNDCAGGNFIQNPSPGTMLTPGNYEINVLILVNNADPDCDFELLILPFGGNTCSISCPADTTVQASANGDFIVPNYLINGISTVTGPCSTGTISQIPAPGSIISIGSNTIYIRSQFNGIITECSFTVTVSLTTSIDDLQYDKPILYPNPVKSILTINSVERIDWITLYDLSGRTIFRTKNTKIDIQAIKSGLYLIELNIGKDRIVRRLIIE